MPVDATLDTVNMTGIKISYIQDLLERCKARQKVLFLDACHSGSGRDVMVMADRFIDQLQCAEGIYTIASCKQDQISHECDETKHGIFTWSLTEAIRNAVPNSSGHVTLDAIFKYCKNTISVWCKPRRITQTPIKISKSSDEIALLQRDLSIEIQLANAKKEVNELKKINQDLETKRLNLENTLEETQKKFESEYEQLCTRYEELKANHLQKEKSIKDELKKARSDTHKVKIRAAMPYVTAILGLSIVSILFVGYWAVREHYRIPLLEKKYKEMQDECSVRNYSKAYFLAQDILGNIKNLSDPHENELYTKTRQFYDEQVAPSFYQSTKVWKEENRLFRFDETDKRKILIHEFPRNIGDVVISPEQKKIAVCDGQNGYVLNIDGSCLVKLTVTVRTIYGWVDIDSISIGYYRSGYGVYEKIIKLNENNSPISD